MIKDWIKEIVWEVFDDSMKKEIQEIVGELLETEFQRFRQIIDKLERENNYMRVEDFNKHIEDMNGQLDKIDAHIKSEDFLDGLVDRIKRKQL